MTLGQLRFHITKNAPGIDPDLLDGWIQNRYTQILDAIPWRRADVEAVLQTVAPFEISTVIVENGSTTVTLNEIDGMDPGAMPGDMGGDESAWDGGAVGMFTPVMTGRRIRIAARDEYYTFTFVSASEGTIDRPYEGDDDTASAYSIFQNIYQLPANARELRGMRVISQSPGKIDMLSRAELDASAPHRIATGVPRIGAQYMDSATVPPVIQIELYPIPDDIYSIPYNYIVDQDALAGSSATLLPWARPSCIEAGVMADYCRSPKVKDLASAREYEAQFGLLLEQMIQIATRQKGGVPLRMAQHYTQHRIRRACASQNRSL
jgi:hypothetical protein